MAKTSDKVKKIVKNKKCECKEIEPIHYHAQEEVKEKATFRILDHIVDTQGLETLAVARGGLFDADIVGGIIEQNQDLLTMDYVELGDGPIGAFHARVEKIYVAKSNTERKGLRATMIVKTEHYYNDGQSAGKETWQEFRDIYPCDCASELIRDIMHEVGEVLFDHVNGEITKYNDKLECKGKCGEGCKCSK